MHTVTDTVSLETVGIWQIKALPTYFLCKKSKRIIACLAYNKQTTVIELQTEVGEFRCHNQ